MSNKPSLSKSRYLPPLHIQQYERYLPNAFDESLTILQKLNKVIHQLNQMGTITNDIVEKWNELMEWIVGNGLTEIVGVEIDKRIADGTFDELIFKIVGDIKLLTTENKDNLVGAINEVNDIVHENIERITNIEKVNEINGQAVTTIGEATGYGVISGFNVTQQNVLAMAVEIGDSSTPNIVHLPNGERYVLDSIALPVQNSHQTLNRIDNIFVNGEGVISYQAGQTAIEPYAPMLPNNSVLLANITVTANDKTVNNVDIIDKRPFKSLNELKTGAKQNFVLAINEVIEELLLVKTDYATNDSVTTTKQELEGLIETSNTEINVSIVDLSSRFDLAIENVLEKLTELNNSLSKTIGDISLLETTSAENIVEAINEIINVVYPELVTIDDNIGSLGTLTTENKENLVDSINEILLKLGDKNLLDTSDKTSVVNAINEIVTRLNLIGEINEDDKDNIFKEIAELKRRFNQLVFTMDDFPKIADEMDDTNRINRALTKLKENGGRLFFPDGEYIVSNRLELVFDKDVRIQIIGGMNAVIKSTTMDYVLNISSATNIGDVEIYNMGFDASLAGEHWDTSTRTQAITVLKCRTVVVQNNRIQNLYGTGILCNENMSVDVSYNTLIDVRGYNVTLDNYGDGIYVGQKTRGITIKNNFIKNNLSPSKRCGRIGITLEFDVANAIVEGNYIYGYNRGIHSELTQGGHKIVGNTFDAVLCGFVSITEKGFTETLVDNNSFSNKGFLNTYSPNLLFKEAMIIIGATEVGHAPKLRFTNNKIDIFNDNDLVSIIGQTNVVSIIRNNVHFEGNRLIADKLVKSRNFFMGSRTNVKVVNNTLTNIGDVTMWFSTDCEFSGNVTSIGKIINQRSVRMKINNNTFSPNEGSLVVGSLLSDRPTGEFNNNTIERYGSETIDNASYATNIYYMDVSNNRFIRKTSDSPILPTKRTVDPEITDALYTRVPNEIVDELTPSNNRQLIFYTSVRTDDGRKIGVTSFIPANKTWKKGDTLLNNNPFIGGYYGWICTADGTPGTWQPFGRIDVLSGATRPSGTTIPLGYSFFDTTINKPIWLRSSNPNVWVDATGATV